jgi:hypothetical protein
MTGVKGSIRRVESEESPTSIDSLELDRERTSGMKKALLEAGPAFSESHTSSGVPQTSSPVNDSPSVVDDDHLQIASSDRLGPSLMETGPCQLYGPSHGVLAGI